jgi:hypothetical protein
MGQTQVQQMKQIKWPLLVRLVSEILLGIIIVEPIVKF